MVSATKATGQASSSAPASKTAAKFPPNRRGRPDVDTIRQAMKGRGVDILSTVGGLPREVLDGKHHPCPKCGGTDRFRYDTKDEFCLCNQCFSTKNGDLFAAVQWALDVDFKEASSRIGDYLGVKPLKSKRKAPDADFEWLDWSSNVLPMLFKKRPGLTEEALLTFGARRAKYKKSYHVIVLPCFGADLNFDKPCGFVMLDQSGGMLPIWSKDGKVSGYTKVKTAANSDAGFIGKHALERLATPGLVEVVWKCEGVTDALTLWAAIPAADRDRHVVVTNAGGAQQSPAWMASMLAQVPRVIVLHDCDEPGQIGAKKWAHAIAKNESEAVNLVLPYDIAKDHGKDVRDWLTQDGGTYARLLDLAGKAEVIKAGAEQSLESMLAPHLRILEKLKLEVLYEANENDLVVFSTLLKKSSTLTPKKLAHHDLEAAAGLPADMYIQEDPDGLNTFSLSQVKTALSLVATYRRGRHDERGIGRLTLGELREQIPTLSKPVIDGLLREGETMNIISRTNARNSWLAYGLAVSVATGWDWLKTFPVSQGRVLILDNELSPPVIVDRLANHVAPGMGISFEEFKDEIEVWSLRGALQTIDQLMPQFESIKKGEFRLVVIDPLYRCLGELKENDNSQMARVYNSLDRIAATTGSGLVVVHHSSKGRQLDKRVSDIGSGAGSQSRAVDAHVALREHEQPGVSVLESVTRSFPPVPPVPLLWRFPCWWVAEGVDCLKLAGRKTRQEETRAKNDREALEVVIKALRDAGHGLGPPLRSAVRSSSRGIQPAPSKRGCVCARRGRRGTEE